VGLQKVYIELVFLDNFIVNLLIILLASRLTKTPIKWGRFSMAAALGGIYGCFAVGLGGWLEMLTVKIAVGFAMCFIAFWKHGEHGFWKNVCAFWAASFVLAGAVYACMISFGDPASIGGAVIVRPPIRYILLGLFVGAAITDLLARVRRRVLKRESQTVMLKLNHGVRQSAVKAFVDTGNLAQDPLSKQSVIFLSHAAARELLGKTLYTLINGQTATPTDRLRIVPCVTAAGQGVFYGIELDEGTLQGKAQGLRAVVCLSKMPLPSGCGAIVGTELLDKLKEGANNEEALGTETDRLGHAAAGDGSKGGLHQRERGTAAAADAAGGGDTASAAGGGGQIGQTRAH
jgi:stage II sporulation protein GA (sporulation sigma-E factor processing peptidase)